MSHDPKRRIRPMNHPSEKALSIAEEMLDYVHPGMSRAAALRELAGMIDEMNADLVDAVTALTHEVKRCETGQCVGPLYHLQEVARQYLPWDDRREEQHEL